MALNTILSLMIMFILINCGKRPADTITIATADTPAAKESIQTESFNEFFLHFTSDSVFQMERVKFPFRILMVEDDGETIHETAQDDWTHSTFYYDESYATREIDAYTQQIKNYGDTVKIELRGVDNGIYLDYKFALENGKWFLVSALDYSN